MTDLDLDRLGDVWREQPDPAELERLQRTAAAVRRRARLGQIVDALAGIAVAVVVILLVLANPKLETFLMGGAAILVLLGANIRQRRLRQVELRSLTGGTEEMLDQSIERIETTLKHNRLSLIAVGPCILVGVLVARSSELGRIGDLIPALSNLPIAKYVWQGTTVAIVAGAILYLLLAIRRGRRERERLRAMRNSYRQERESTG
jgi:membrane protein implicated in regulation of membrane protease activity